MKDQGGNHAYSFAPTFLDHQKRQARLVAKWQRAGDSLIWSTPYYHSSMQDSPFFPHDFDHVPRDTLSNSIHPIFSPQNFPGQAYPLLIPVLRLATRLLIAPPLLPFWHALFFGDVVPVPDLGTSLGCYYRTQSVLSRRAVIATHAALTDLAEIVRFYPRFPRKIRRGNVGLTAYCDDHWATGDRMWSMPDHYGLPGPGSIIHVSPKMEMDLRDCATALKVGAGEKGKGVTTQQDAELAEWTEWEEERLDPASAQSLVFTWANTLVHEVAHAAHRVALPPGAPHEYFFEDGLVAEAGHDWEAWAFGGCPQLIDTCISTDGDTRSASFVTLEPWPRELNKGNGVSEPPRRAETLPGVTRDGYGFFWRVDQEFVAKLFTDEFWDNEVVTRGREALWPKKELGMRFRSEQDWIMEKGDELPEGFNDCVLDWNGLVTRLPRSIDPDGFGRLLKMPLLDA